MADGTTDGPVLDESLRTLERVRARKDEFTDFLAGMCRIESPSDQPRTQDAIHAYLAPAFEELGYDVRIVRSRTTGNHLLASPRGRRRAAPSQLLIGHSDTVWPLGTLARMPVEVVEGRLHGPGSLDMKGGLSLIVFALRTLRELELEPEVTPVVFINADEEVGSPDSRRHIRRLARTVERAFVLEPSLGPRGLIKTARKGVGRFQVTVRGRPTPGGTDPESGASAILELSHVIQRLNALNDPGKGTTVNVGLVDGGTGSDAMASEARATADVRVADAEEGRRVEERILGLEPATPGVTLDITGRFGKRPLERTPRNRRLWGEAQRVGRELGMELEHAMAGGGSDGNTTSLFTATLDGLGCVGAGAHADHEHVVIDPSLDRCALLARLILSPSGLARR